MEKSSSIEVNPNDTKYYNMKQFINLVSEYIQTKAEDTANVINRTMQLLSVSVDLSIFDPHTSIASEFYVSLYELLSNVEPRSPLAWCSVNVLSLACKNPASRHALIHTYQFLPLLSRLVGDHLTTEKKIRLLALMQELTCGIKISWQIPHLSHLMATLTKWVEGQDEEIITLSLGILVNLCYKNLPAIYTLSRCVDIKKFVRMCVPLQGVKIEVHVCKLLIILEYMNGQVPKAAFLKLMEVTFKSLTEAYKARDPILLRHVVEFFLDVSQQGNHMDVILSYENFAIETEKLMITIEGNLTNDDHPSENIVQQEPECMALLLEFFHAVIEMKIPKIELLHSRMVALALKWLQVEAVCSQALAVLRTVAVNSAYDSTISEQLMVGLPIFTFVLNVSEDDFSASIERNKRLNALMQLLKVLVLCPNSQSRIVNAIENEYLEKIFLPLLGLKSPRERATDASTMSPEAIGLYVNAVALIVELAKINPACVDMRDELLKHRQIHMVLAQALYNGCKDTKATVLELTSNKCISPESIANAMTEMQSLIGTDDHRTVPGNGFNDSTWCFPVMSVSQLERLDEVINKLNTAVSQNNMINVSTSDVMELFEYKLASMRHVERASIVSMEAASQRSTHLQHRAAQLTAELNRLHQLLFHVQQCHEEVTKARDEIQKSNSDLSNRLEAEKGRCKVASSQLAAKERLLAEKTTELEDALRRLHSAEEGRTVAEEQITDLRRVIAKLEENLVRKEKLVEKKEELTQRLTITYDSLKMQASQLEKRLQLAEAELAEKASELSEKTKELTNCRQLIDTITKLTHSQSKK
ncbi:uncharacterized protein LOC108732610 isoform X2 [Agrilus planipennis]|nr:uncharacterized protein LOC108732610 isoform X2 [Agrilus planipennis]